MSDESFRAQDTPLCVSRETADATATRKIHSHVSTRAFPPPPLVSQINNPRSSGLTPLSRSRSCPRFRWRGPVPVPPRRFKPTPVPCLRGQAPWRSSQRSASGRAAWVTPTNPSPTVPGPLLLPGLGQTPSPPQAATPPSPRHLLLLRLLPSPFNNPCSAWTCWPLWRTPRLPRCRPPRWPWAPSQTLRP